MGLTLSRAVDLYIGELARRGRTLDTQRTYQRHLFAFMDSVGEKTLGAIDKNDFDASSIAGADLRQTLRTFGSARCVVCSSS